MLFFTHIMAYSTIVCLGRTVPRITWQEAEHQLMVPGYEQRINWALAEIVRLVKGLPSLCYIKAHPFLPNLLSSAITFLSIHKEYDQAGVEVLLCLLKNTRDVNSLALQIYSTYEGTQSSLPLCNK